MAVETAFYPPPPATFRGLDPNVPLRRYERRLPHWRQPGATYSVTFRLADALPQSKLRLLKQLQENWERAHPIPRSDEDWQSYDDEILREAERWLDAGYGACHFRERRWCEVLAERFHFFQDAQYRLHCYAILPNHAHLMLRPLSGHALEEIVGAMKGVSARLLNLELKQDGPLWQQESYDRLIRDGEHLWHEVQYFGRNPELAGVGEEAGWRRWIDPQWQAAGWGFRDE